VSAAPVSEDASLERVRDGVFFTLPDALGPPARGRRRDALNLFATYIRDRLARSTDDGRPPPELPWTAYIGVVYAARQLASDALDTAPEPDLAALGADLEVWVSDLARVR
jgi:hypothetical protein